ncbi:SNF2 family N-terminal domain-containing protein [Aspergillus pseudoustus]|uniref:SNF2 family N-terminal domain-containing protein n=1 Tax=Aspergillus pseudoustus TaxID=1810923 RepID=A0ABR4II84_9EURO
MARKKSVVDQGPPVLAAPDPSSLPRRKSLRLAQNPSTLPSDTFESEEEIADTEDKMMFSGIFKKDLGQPKLEVAIPLKKPSSRSASSSVATEDTSADGTTGYDTPATSVAVTPAESDGGGPKKRVSASARARDLRSSTMSLGARRGVKRPCATDADDYFTSESADAALAKSLQMQEYGQTLPKRKKTLDDTSMDDNSDINNPSDVLDDSDLYEETLDQPVSRRRTKVSLRSTQSRVVLDSDGMVDYDSAEEDAYQEASDWSDSVSSLSDEEPLAVQRAVRLANRPRQNPPRRHLTSSVAARALASGMSYRAVKERQKLEKQHPSIKTMWEDLKNDPPISPVPATQPPGISRTLKPFQLEGLNWMTRQEKTQYEGGLLGDEMGMGKTIQAVSLLMSDYPVGKPSLVVVPPVALMQWQSEIKEYTSGQLKVLVYHNSNSKVKTLSKKDLLKYDVIMISYSGLESMHRKEWKGWNRNDGIVKEDSVIHSIHFHRLILDEAHSIKQRTTSVARACFALQSTYKWCLSGTPVQNRIGEFFSLLRFLEVRPFACYFCKQCKCQELHWSQDAEKRCTKCKHSGFSHVSVFNQEILNPITERTNPEARKEALAKLRLITDRIMLRRVKRDHTASMELPPKRVILHNEFFGEIERDFSKSIMTNSSRQFDTYVSRGVMLNNYANIFGLIMQMRQVANHPDLILKKHAEGGQNVLVCSICDEPAEEAIRSRCHHDFCRRCAKDYMRSFDADSIVDCPRCHIPLSIDLEQPDMEQHEDHIKKNSIVNRIRMEDWTSSTKIEMLVYELYKLRSKKQTLKSIVFSQFTSMLQLVEWRLRRAGFNTVMLDGTMTPAQRQKSIDYFMNNVNVEVFLVSLKAGGVALNLTEASRVFIVDPYDPPIFLAMNYILMLYSV